MSADNFNALPPEIRAFWKNFQLVYLQLYRPGYILPLVHQVDLTPIQLATRQLTFEQLYGLPADPARPNLVANTFDLPIDTPVYEPLTGVGYPDAASTIKTYYYPADLREKYRVKRSYWTGCCRRRRNL
jgi:hypothetical protein